MNISRETYSETHESMESIVAEYDDYDRVKCESCGAVIYKDDAIRLSNGDWLCERDALAVGELERGRI